MKMENFLIALLLRSNLARFKNSVTTGDRGFPNADVSQLEAERREERRGRRHGFLINHDDYAIFVCAISPERNRIWR